MNRIKNICICGGGSLGIVCSGVFLSHKCNVSLLTGHPDVWKKDIKVIDTLGKEFGGSLQVISNDPKAVISEADLVFLTLPGFLIEKNLRDIKPYLKSNAIIGSVVSSTGFFFAAHNVFGSQYCLFGFQRVPYIARQLKYGEIGELLGYKTELKVAIEYCQDQDQLKSELEHLFGTPIIVLNNFLEASLTNSNPILHTGRLYALWKDYQGELFKNPSMFYADWTDEASDYLIKMDEEFQTLLRKLGIKEDVIPTLLDYYESYDAKSLTNKIKSIKAFQSIKSPMKRTDEGWIPDFNSRYFTEDFPYGLRFIRDLSKKYGIKTPVIDKVYEWGIKHISTPF